MNWIRDWWRGWSEADLESYLRKIADPANKPGCIVQVSYRELNAAAHYWRTMNGSSR